MYVVWIAESEDSNDNNNKEKKKNCPSQTWVSPPRPSLIFQIRSGTQI